VSGPVNIKSDRASTEAPEMFERIAHVPALLPGEHLEDYEALRRMIVGEVAPQSGIEWLWTLDLVELSWDIQRYRALRFKVLEMYRQNAVESSLRRVDSAGIPAYAQDDADRQIKRNALQWRNDQAAATEIEARLASLGFDARAIDLEVVVQAKEIFVMFDALMHSAQNRRIFLLREINARRSIAKRVRAIYLERVE
jgi:hypothetical protein